MHRLLQGDVGAGKTLVAVHALLVAVQGGHQGALMAPTEVLAEQHFRTICLLLSGEPEPPLNGLVTLPFLDRPLRIVLLTGSASRYSCTITGPLITAATRSGPSRVSDGDASGLVS